MTVIELTTKLKALPDDWGIYCDDLNGGRIPIEEFRVEPAEKFVSRGKYSKPSLVVISPNPRLEQF